MGVFLGPRISLCVHVNAESGSNRVGNTFCSCCCRPKVAKPTAGYGQERGGVYRAKSKARRRKIGVRYDVHDAGRTEQHESRVLLTFGQPGSFWAVHE